MKSGIFNTDNNWLSVLRKNSIREGVNFWRKDKRTLHLPSGSPFYFKDEWEFNGPFLEDSSATSRQAMGGMSEPLNTIKVP